MKQGMHSFKLLIWFDVFSNWFDINKYVICMYDRGRVASWLVHSTPEQAVWVRALAVDIVLCSWPRHYTLTLALSAQMSKWIPANLILWVTL